MVMARSSKCSLQREKVSNIDEQKVVSFSSKFKDLNCKDDLDQSIIDIQLLHFK